MVYVLKMEYVSKINIFWPKNDGKKWSRKNYFEKTSMLEDSYFYY